MRAIRRQIPTQRVEAALRKTHIDGRKRACRDSIPDRSIVTYRARDGTSIDNGARGVRCRRRRRGRCNAGASCNRDNNGHYKRSEKRLRSGHGVSCSRVAAGGPAGESSGMQSSVHVDRWPFTLSGNAIFVISRWSPTALTYAYSFKWSLRARFLHAGSRALPAKLLFLSKTFGGGL